MLTERHKESQRIFQQIIRNSPGILFHLEVDLIKKEERYLFISENYAELFEVEIEYACTHKLLQTTLSPESLAQFKEEFHAIVAGEDQVEMEIQICTPKGNTKWLKVSATIERQGHTANLFGIYLDITTQKELFLKQERITSTLLTLNKHPSVHSGNMTDCMQLITRSLSEALDISRVSIWKYNADKSSITCVQLFDHCSGRHSEGGTLSKVDFRPYFDYLEKHLIVKAFDAETHEATTCFTELYLRPLGIKTIVDVPIYHDNRIVGVLCSECTGDTRVFENNEIQLMVNVSEIYSYAFSLAEQNRYKQELEYLNRNLNQLVKERTHVLEMKSREVINSINYAKRIQQVILPSSAILSQAFSEHFVMYNPKDIVSGDFYWFTNKDGARIVACADCTGHGVPGSLVSLICYNELNKAVNDVGISDPGLVLDRCRQSISGVFNSGTDTIRDGMDISLLIIDPSNRSFHWAGANNPLWYRQKGHLQILKGDKQHVGYNENPRAFTTHSVQLDGSETFYLFTDGFADQFGGELGKKYKTSAFKALIESGSHLSLTEQQERIANSFRNWKQSLEQVDDVSVIGFRL